MEQLILDLSFKVLSSTYATCFIALLVTDFVPYVDQFCKLVLLLLGISAGVLMRKSAKMKVEQARNELEASRIKLEEERMKTEHQYDHQAHIHAEVHIADKTGSHAEHGTGSHAGHEPGSHAGHGPGSHAGHENEHNNS